MRHTFFAPRLKWISGAFGAAALVAVAVLMLLPAGASAAGGCGSSVGFSVASLSPRASGRPGQTIKILGSGFDNVNIDGFELAEDGGIDAWRDDVKSNSRMYFVVPDYLPGSYFLTIDNGELGSCEVSIRFRVLPGTV